MNEITYHLPHPTSHIRPYLLAATCKGRRGVVVGTNTKDLKERAEKYFYHANETKN